MLWYLWWRSIAAAKAVKVRQERATDRSNLRVTSGPLASRPIYFSSIIESTGVGESTWRNKIIHICSIVNLVCYNNKLQRFPLLSQNKFIFRLASKVLAQNCVKYSHYLLILQIKYIGSTYLGLTFYDCLIFFNCLLVFIKLIKLYINRNSLSLEFYKRKKERNYFLIVYQ